MRGPDCPVCHQMSRTRRQAQGYGWRNSHQEANHICSRLRDYLLRPDLPQDLLHEALVFPALHGVLANNALLPLLLLERTWALPTAFIDWCNWKADPDKENHNRARTPYAFGPQVTERINMLLDRCGLPNAYRWNVVVQARINAYGMSAATLFLRILWAAQLHVEDFARWPLARFLPWPSAETATEHLVEWGRRQMAEQCALGTWDDEVWRRRSVPDLELAWQRLLDGPPLPQPSTESVIHG